MRPLEIVLTVTNFLSVFFLFVAGRRGLARRNQVPASPGIPFDSFRGALWSTKITALAGLPVAVAQVIVEGVRWQLVPAYFLAFILFVVRLLEIAIAGRGHLARAVATLGRGASIVIFLLSATVPVILPIFHLPKPTGPYAVGTVTYHWVDSSRAELFTAADGDYRSLMAQVWYPARKGAGRKRAPYIEDARVVTPALSRLFHLPAFFFSYFKYVATDAVEDAPVASTQESYPVIIYLTGLGGFPSTSMFQVQELASRGYVVIGLGQPGGASVIPLPDGKTISVLPRAKIQALIDQSLAPSVTAPTLYGKSMPEGILPYFAQDVSFTIDEISRINRSGTADSLAGRMDTSKIGVFGVSLGAMVAAQAASMDSRVSAVLMMDAAMPADVVRGGLRQPSMWMTRPAASMRLERSRSGGWSEKDIAETLTSMREVFEASAPGRGYYLQMPGMFHVNFTDAPVWSPLASQIGLTGPVDGRKMFSLVNSYTVAFFDHYLKDTSEPILEEVPAKIPDVIFEKR